MSRRPVGGAARRGAALLAPMSDRTAYRLALLGGTLAAVVLVLTFLVIALFRRPDGGAVPDFAAFWAAAVMTLEGRPALAYDWAAHRAVQAASLGDFAGWMPWHYPPVFQILVLPLGLLPIFVAQAVWVVGTLGAYLAVVHRILPGRTAVLAALVPLPVFIGAVAGQTSFIVPALTGLALLHWQRRPVVAGVALGFLGIKPHLALAFPVALIAERRGRILTVGLLTVLGLVVLSVAGLGVGTWRAFLGSLGATSDAFTVEGPQWHMLASLYGRLRLAGFDAAPALAAQGVVSAAVVWALWRGLRAGVLAPDAKAALIAYACIAMAPRVLDYDLLTLYVGALFQIRHARRAGFFPGECLVFGAALIGTALDFLSRAGDLWLKADVNFMLAPMLMAALMWGEARRDPQTARPPVPASAGPAPGQAAIRPAVAAGEARG